jgi:GTPase
MSKKIPEVLIIGRPNVGKSTLLNRIIGKIRAITFDTPGVTRDLLHYSANWEGKQFFVVDSGGVFFEKSSDFFLQGKIEKLVKRAIERAKKIVFVTECKVGLTPMDETIASWLRPYQDKVVLAVNKADPGKKNSNISEFYKLGMGEPFPISSTHGTGVMELLDKVIEAFDSDHDLESIYKSSYHISMVGRPNVGKSSLINALLNDERVLVDSEAGTTRDSTEIFFHHKDHEYVFIDTAGMRKKSRIKDGIEYYSVLRSSKAIDRSDLVLVLLEPEMFLCDQDKKIIQMVVDAHRNMVIVVNKWDLTPRTSPVRDDLIRMAHDFMPSLKYYPFLFVSAEEKLNLGKIFQTIPNVIASGENRTTTASLNKFVEAVIKQNPPPSKGGRSVKIYYVTQAEVSPPTFVFFVNEPKLVNIDYKRFLERRLREFLDRYHGNPIRLVFKATQRDKKDWKKGRSRNAK